MTSPKAIKGSVLSGLRMNSDLTPLLVPTVTFSPTLGITAARIDKLGLDIRSFKEPLDRAIRQVMVPSIRKNFDEGGRPTWEPLSEFTIRMRESQGVGGNTLVRSGTLRRVASQINIWDVTTTSAVIRDLPQSAWYGKVHQGGYGSATKALKVTGTKVLNKGYQQEKITSASKGRVAASIPARPFLIIQPEDEDAIAEIFIKWLGERVLLAWPT